MSYPHQVPYQQDSVHGGQPHVPGHDRRTSRSLQPPVQVGDNPLASRPLSTSRPQAHGQAQPFDNYGAVQNREHPQAGPFVPSTQTPPYMSPQGGQIHSPTFPGQTYQPVEPYIQPPAGPPPQLVTPQHRSPPQQSSAPPQQLSSPHSPAHPQYPPYQRDHSAARNPQQQQWSSTPQYPQQQQHHQPSPQRYPQQQQSSPPQHQTPYSAPNVPGEDVTRQSRSLRRDTSPPCRFQNCRNPAVRDGGTQELTEYCSVDHMRDDLQRGAPPCIACKKCPRRIDGNYCGSSCEKWDRQRQQQPQQRQQQYYPPAGVRPNSLASSSGNASGTWRTSTGGSVPTATGNPQANIQHLSPAQSVGGLVRCQRCHTTYSVRGRSRPRYETEPGNPVALTTLPPCPQCGFSSPPRT